MRNRSTTKMLQSLNKTISLQKKTFYFVSSSVWFVPLQVIVISLLKFIFTVHFTEVAIRCVIVSENIIQVHPLPLNRDNKYT